MFFLRLFGFLLALCAIHTQALAAPSSTGVPEAKLRPFLEANCAHCHGEKKQKGQVRFDQATWKITNNDEAQRWQDVLDVLNAGEMPPEDEPQPSSEDMSAALDTLTRTLQKARKRLTAQGGEVAMRRLNQREYSNSIRALFGFDVPADRIPDDSGDEHFDTIGADQFFTSSDFEKYLKLGTEIAKEGISSNRRPRQKSKIDRKQPEGRVTRKLRDKLADLDAKMQMKKEGKTWKEMGFKDEGEMQIIFSQFGNRAGLPRRYLQLPLVDSGVYLTGITGATKDVSISRHTDSRGSYIVRVHAGIVGNPDPVRKILRLTDNYGIKGTLQVQGTAAKPETIEMPIRAMFGRRMLSVKAHESMPNFTQNTIIPYLKKLQGSDEQWGSIWIDWIEMEGPFYDDEPSFLEALLEPRKGHNSKLLKDGSARELIEKFAFEAFRRRAPEPAFLDGLEKHFKELRTDGASHENAMAEVFGVILASPGFLYLQEDKPARSQALNDRQLAIRLAYFLWSAPPDEELYAIAASQTLTKPEVLKAQIERMLKDPKRTAFDSGFASQWAELDRFDAITVDEREHFRFNDGIRHSAYREVAEFFSLLVSENLPAKNLIDSDFVTIDATLATHYGLADFKAVGNAFQKVSLPADSPRGGLIGQAAFLTLGSNGERSSPVIRGALVMEKLLHDKPPPPPPNVPELGSASKRPLTNRQMVMLHQKQAQCSSCHKKMDVIGFGLENFDVVGRWRDTEKVGRKQVPIEPGGTLPGGGAFSDIDGLKKQLLVHEDKLARELVESMLTYGLGRTIEFSDADSVDQILSSIKADGYQLRTMLHAIISSPVFRSK